tara:strand:- start:3117 stop:4163 length:1047 start_codon:yes stop_codon:yes gene_type:complete
MQEGLLFDMFNCCRKVIAKLIKLNTPYWLKYLPSYLLSKIKTYHLEEDNYDLAFILDKNMRGWILEGICNEIVPYFQGKHIFYYGNGPFPKARNYFFPYYHLYISALKRNPILFRRNSVLLYTHPKIFPQHSQKEIVFAMNRCQKIVIMNSHIQESLVQIGIKKELLKVVLGAADSEIFPTHQRAGNVVGLCSAYYKRKNPELIVEVIKQMPHCHFLLIGKDWEKYERFVEIKDLDNFEYIQIPYKDYPKQFSRMNVFFSPSFVEGGPIPLIEAMMSNVYPVASNTGFAEDLIDDDKNGIIFDPMNNNIDEIIYFIDKGLTQTNKDIRTTVLKYTWQKYASELFSLMK